uniref:Fc receptor-like protein 5 isoform X3 n=1 Tax=Scatophagus argus TaxID=75038 RepID=UPI001ED80885|nr:Fc receptor-like protein 5 isoform X3 [Scatophagus argus]
MRNLQTLNLLTVVALVYSASLSTKINDSSVLRPVLTGSDLAYLSTRATFWCIAPGSSPPVTYELMRDDGVLIAAETDFTGGQHVPFSLKVTATPDVSYYCKATAGGSTGVSNSIKLSVVTPPSNTRVTSEPSPTDVYVGSHIVLNCNVTKGSHLSYTWFFNRTEVTSSTFSSLHLSGNTLVLGKVTPEHAGYYSCMAWSRVQDIKRFSSSSEVQVTVKVYVSKPRISFSFSNEGDGYRGNVTCWSTRGSPPVNFSLLLDDKEAGSVTTTESLTAWFPVAFVPGLDMGTAQCRVKNDVQELMSEPVTLVVVPVGGEVKVEVEYLYRADSKLAAARLHCLVSRGTFPYVSWLLNGSILPSQTHEDSFILPAHDLSHYAIADHRQIIFLAKLGPKETGYYHCRARDSYNDSGPWVESAAVLVPVTGILMNIMNTTEIVTIWFCCFLFLMLVVSVGCFCKMFDHNQAHTHSAVTNPSSVPLPLSPLVSQSGGEQADTSCTDCDVQNQTVEITV